MTRLVQLTTYPLKTPRHGGQLRCAAIRACYRNLGIDVDTIAVLHGTDYPAADHERNDIVLRADSPFFDPLFPRLTDLQRGRFLVTDAQVWQRFRALLDRLQPDAIQLEQPWLYPAVRRWFAERSFTEQARPRLIYSSQNIEWKLKRDERFADASRAGAYAREVEKVLALEREVVHAADLVIACTDEELAELRAMAGDGEASRRVYVTAHNAIAPFTIDDARVAAMKRRLGLDRFALFVGSAHPPNADGFWDMLAPSLAFLRPDETIVVAGGVGHLLRSHKIYRAWPGINEPRLAVLGEIERADLDALLGGAAAILLPITTGGGSNLKTAEAIYSGRPVLATPHALRGYGDTVRWPTITLADTSDAFRRVLRGILDRAAPTLRANYTQIRAEVTWERTLAPLAVAISTLLEPPASSPEPALGDVAPTHFEVTLAAIQEAVQGSGGIDYEALLERHYTKLIRCGDTVVDIGAHTGRHLAKFIECVGRGGRVFGFEPLPFAYAILQRNFRGDNVVLENVALTDTTGHVEFVHAQGAPEESGLRERVYNRPEAVTPVRIEVRAEKLDHYAGVLAGLRFVKIDVEGAEMNVLRGATAVLERYRPIVSVEYGRPAYGAYGHDTFTLFDFAEQHGFAMYDIFANRLGREEWALACDSVYWDYFMVPLEKEAGFVRDVPPTGPTTVG
ncbi:MAG: FkbM family methyltransferase [Lysobacterales bacterium]